MPLDVELPVVLPFSLMTAMTSLLEGSTITISLPIFANSLPLSDATWLVTLLGRDCSVTDCGTFAPGCALKPLGAVFDGCDDRSCAIVCFCCCVRFNCSAAEAAPRLAATEKAIVAAST